MDFVITNLPIIKGMVTVEKKVVSYGLLEGTSVETSGGLLIAMPGGNAEGYIKEFKEKFNMDSWVVGKVVEGNNKAYLAEEVTITEC